MTHGCRSFPRHTLLAAVLSLACAPPLLAQATATINGRVVDEGAAVLPGVAITVTQVGTGITRTTITNAEGLFTIPALTPGRYDLRAELSGFAPSARGAVELVTGSTVTADFTLALAGVSESVTVEGQAPLVEVTQSAMSSTIRQQEVEQLPMINRSLAAMLTLLPGVREMPAQGAHGHASSYVSVGGGNGRNFQMIVDGSDNKEDHDGGTTMVYSLEGVQEFRALTSTFTAEYGKAAAVIVLATKSGTNEVRGSLFGYGRNEQLVATDYFSDPKNGGLGKPPFKRLQFGGSIGGPLIRDRAFFFAALERVHQDFELPRPESIYRELVAVQNALPNANILASRSMPQPFRDLMGQAKVNVQLNQNHDLYVRYALQKGHVLNAAPPLGGSASRALLANEGFLDKNIQNMWNTAVGWTWVVDSSTVNQFRAQYLYYLHDNQYPPCPEPVCSLGRLNFPSVQTGPPLGGGFPQWTNIQEKFEFRNDFSKQIGSHALKTGASYMPIPKYGGVFGPQTPGGITFRHDPTTIINNTNGLYPQGFQTPGVVQSLVMASGTIGNYDSEGAWNFGAYVQDDWRLGSKVTVNLGVRYDVYNLMSASTLETNRTYRVLKAIGSPFGALPTLDTNNVAPRVGLAWDVRGDGGDVIRGGFGIFYGQGIMNSYVNQNFQQKPTVYFAQTLANSAIGVGPLANYVYGVTPLPSMPAAPTDFPPGLSIGGSWFHPDLKDSVTEQAHVGWSHLLTRQTVVSVDYSHIRGRNGWRNLNINPLLPTTPGVDLLNPTGPRARPLSALTQAVLGDPNFFGPVTIVMPVNRSRYDEMVLHFERRFERTALQANYTLAYARGLGGTADPSTAGGALVPQIPSATGGEYDAPWEWGPSAHDERHRLTIAGVIELPLGFNVAPSITAASARPYTQYRAQDPNGNLMLLGADGKPVGVNRARGVPLFVANARLTRSFDLAATSRRLDVFAEFYNITNRANFGANFGNLAFAPTTYGRPTGYLGGIGSTSTIPNSFQVQFGARFAF